MTIDQRAGMTVNWAQNGQGAPCVMVHCSLAHAGAWAGVQARLQDQLDMIAFDMPDHGRSDVMPDGADSQAKVAEIIDSFCEEPAHIVAHSFGATAALLFAETNPQKVASLTLVEPVLFKLLNLSDTDPADLSAHNQMVVAWNAGDRDAAAQAFVTEWGDGQPWDAIHPAQKAYIVDRIHVVVQQNPSVMEDVNNVTGPGRLEALTMPIRLIRGGTSPKAITQIHAGLMQRLPNAQEVVIEGAGHMCPITHPQKVAQVVQGLL